MKVFTYYSPILGLWSNESQQALLRVWERSWKKAGWEPVVLTESDTYSHPRFDFFKEHFWSKPTEYGHDYCGACFMRWLAVAHAGGGMMVDYDVINYGFSPMAVIPGQMTLIADVPPGANIFMGVVSASHQHFLDMAEIFAAWKPDEYDVNEKTGKQHCDDLTLLIRMFNTETYPKPDWLVTIPGCALFDNPTWTSCSLVHYAYAMHQKGYWPKHEWIEQLRPF